jgi:hypothetical protein
LQNPTLVFGDPKIGDHIFFARGATNPLVLRPVVDDQGFSEVKETHRISTLYKFIGGSYVHGIMDGEVLDMIDGMTVREESVCLV